MPAGAGAVGPAVPAPAIACGWAVSALTLSSSRQGSIFYIQNHIWKFPRPPPPPPPFDAFVIIFFPPRRTKFEVYFFFISPSISSNYGEYFSPLDLWVPKIMPTILSSLFLHFNYSRYCFSSHIWTLLIIYFLCSSFVQSVILYISCYPYPPYHKIYS